MRERVNDTIRYHLHRLVLPEESIQQYIDQAPTHSNVSNYWHFFAAYTPHGVACIEATFRDRMLRPARWDSRELIRRDILTNPHLHLTLKEGLLDAFERVDWARWYDNFYVLLIRGFESGTDTTTLEASIREDQNLSELSRDNLLLNLRNYGDPQILVESEKHPGV